jgi:nucleoid-associated protein Lsr2
MARRSIVTVTSDVSGEDAHETVQLRVDGHTYELDLTETEAHDLRSLLRPYMAAGRRVNSAGKVMRHIKVEAAQTTVRAWARSAGVDVSSRGRIPKQVRDQFEAAQQRAQTVE